MKATLSVQCLELCLRLLGCDDIEGEDGTEDLSWGEDATGGALDGGRGEAATDARCGDDATDAR